MVQQPRSGIGSGAAAWVTLLAPLLAPCRSRNLEVDRLFGGIMRVRLLVGLLSSLPLVACADDSSPPLQQRVRCDPGFEACTAPDGTVCVPTGTCADYLCGEGFEACNAPDGTVCVPTGTCAEFLGTGSTSGSGGSPPVGGGGSGPTGGVGAGGTVTGGAPPTGGAPTGGAPLPTCSVGNGTCSETSSSLKTIDTDWGYARSNVEGDLKTYMFGANWWGAYNNQVITVDGLGFRISGSALGRNGDAPEGFPTMFIGKYQGRGTECSDLPIQVSAITQIPTVFQTNVTSLNNSDLNATYDVWFTANGNTLPDTQDNPGSGGAYLMVWMHKPSNRQPVGSQSGTASIAGQNWNVWYGQGYNAPVVSYVSSTPINGLTFDLNDFIQNAVQNGRGVTSNQYLSVVFAGFEVWSGGDGLEMSQFCVDVM
jgi:hypothetical protein